MNWSTILKKVLFFRSDFEPPNSYKKILVKNYSVFTIVFSCCFKEIENVFLSISRNYTKFICISGWSQLWYDNIWPILFILFVSVVFSLSTYTKRYLRYNPILKYGPFDIWWGSGRGVLKDHLIFDGRGANIFPSIFFSRLVFSLNVIVLNFFFEIFFTFRVSLYY